MDVVSCRELKRVGRSVSLLLTDAAVEKRVTCGLRPAIKALDRDPQRVLCCVVPQSGTRDAASHIQTTLLQAFCYENAITIIKVGLCSRQHVDTSLVINFDITWKNQRILYGLPSRWALELKHTIYYSSQLIQSD